MLTSFIIKLLIIVFFTNYDFVFYERFEYKKKFIMKIIYISPLTLLC
jgi:hypothetical protein